MKKLGIILGIIASLGFILFTAVTCVRIVAFSNSFFEKEFAKFEVDAVLQMEMEDVLIVADEMMDYLGGKRPDLNIQTTMNQEKCYFFNEREKSHMIDVKNILDTSIVVSYISLFCMIVSICCLIRYWKDWKRLVATTYQIVIGSMIGIIGIITIIIVTGDFTKYWNLFHELFFSNDLWLLDPDTDMMINMLPEGFFVDLIVNSLLLFMGVLCIFLITSIISKTNKKD